MKKPLFVLIILILFSGAGLAKFAYIGPYQVEFNDTDHPITLLSLEPSFAAVEVYTDGYLIYLQYRGVSLFNESTNSTMTIDIIEGEMGDSVLSNLTTLAPKEGQITIKKFDRIVDGKDAMVVEYNSTNDGGIYRKAVFVFPVDFKYYDYDDQRAIVYIEGHNYTEREYDRLLDTFRIKRLVEK